MKSIKNGALIFLVMLFVYPVSVSAGELITVREQNEKDALNISESLTIVLSEILNTYRGNVTVDELYRAAMTGIADILDQFSRFFSEEEFLVFSGHTSGYTVVYGFIISEDMDGNVVVYSVFENSVAESAGILENDIIESMNNVSVKGLDLDVVLELANSNTNDYLKISIIRGDEIKPFLLERGSIAHRTVSVTHFNDIFYYSKYDDNDHIRHVSISRIGQDTSIEFKNYIEIMKNAGVEKIILDLRGNLGGNLYTAIEISKMLIPESTIMFIVDNDDNKHEVYTNLGNRPFEEIVVLVDNNTASSAEIIVAALQDSGSTIVGSTTHGKGVIQTALELPAGGILMLTTHESLRSNGDPIDNVGIIPDIYITFPNFLMRSGVSDTDIFINAMEILELIGYEVGYVGDKYDYTNLQAIHDFQVNNGIEVSYVIDMSTISALNESLFTVYFEMDRVLEIAYGLII